MIDYCVQCGKSCYWLLCSAECQQSLEAELDAEMPTVCPSCEITPIPKGTLCCPGCMPVHDGNCCFCERPSDDAICESCWQTHLVNESLPKCVEITF